MDYNSNAVLDGDNAVYCGRCKVKTPHRLTREFDPDVLLIEIIRVTETSRNNWLKNGSPVNFTAVGVNLPGFSRFYRVVALVTTAAL